MKIILPSSDEVITVDDDDLPFFSRYRWCIVGRNNLRYLQGRVDGRKVYFHRALLNAPPGKVVDHKDGNGLNNSRENIRIVTQRENTWNRRHIKVHFTDGYWHVAMRVGDRRIHVGYFEDEVTAKKAKAFVAGRIRGEMARETGLDLSDFDPLLLTPTTRALLVGSY